MGEIVTIAGHVCVSLECRCIAQRHRDRAEGLRKRVLNAQRQRACRERLQTIEALPRRINEALETGVELVKRAREGKRHL